MTGTLFVVATPIGNLEDLSPRAARILGEVEMIAAEDTRTVKTLLARAGVQGAAVRSYFEGNEASRSEELLGVLQDGRSVAIVSEAGSPSISDPGQRLVAAAANAGVRVEVIPGPNAAICALVASGLPTDEFRFIGFPPRERGRRAQRFGKLRGDPATLVLYESPERISATLADLRSAFGGQRRVCLSREMTKKFEEHIRGTIDEVISRVADTPPRGECTLVVEGSAEEIEIDVEAEMRVLLEQGLGAKDAAARLVVKTGKPRRELYQLALSLKRELDAPG